MKRKRPRIALLFDSLSSEYAVQLRRAVERCLLALVDAKDPAQHYDSLIRASAPKAEGSGLGLARLRAEGELTVDYSIDGDQLTITVHASVEPRKGAPLC